MTEKTPKPLLSLRGKPILQHLIENLRAQGVQKFILSLGYGGEEIEHYFKDGSAWGVQISYSRENEPRGTGGAVKEAAKGLTEPFFLFWGDNLMDADINQMEREYLREQPLVLMTLTPREDVENFGAAKLDGNKILSFVEKPKREEAPSNLINAGAFILRPECMAYLPDGRSSIERDCFEKIAPLGKMTAFIHRGQWFPTDTVEKYLHAEKHFRPRFLANPSIFKAYDIRGEWGKDWDREFVYRIGKAITLYLPLKNVAIGRDMRKSSEEIFHVLCQSLREEGIGVKDLGLCGTELTYFATSFVPEIDLAIMITASHNPGKDNGLKITLRNSLSLGLDSGLDKIRDLALGELNSTEGKTAGTLEYLNLWPQYKAHVFYLAGVSSKVFSEAKKKVVIDAGNGIGSLVFDQVLGETIPAVRLFWTPDGSFPHHSPDPFQEKNVTELKKKVLQEKADIGIAYDGDSDRVFVVDETGKYIPGYYLAALLTEYLLSQKEGPENEIIVHDPRYFWATCAAAEKYHARHLPSKVGHTLIKAKMREYNSLFSAECSGHIFYRENNFAESSMLTTLLVLKLVIERGPLSEQMKHLFENYPLSGEINFIVENSAEVLSLLERTYAAGQISKLDGLSVDFTDWRFNVRGSNTQPLLRLNIEGKSKQLVEEKLAELKHLIGGRIAEH